jgi:hypothetical protein
LSGEKGFGDALNGKLSAMPEAFGDKQGLHQRDGNALSFLVSLILNRQSRASRRFEPSTCAAQIRGQSSLRLLPERGMPTLSMSRLKNELKSLKPEDTKAAVGHGLRAKGSKSGAVSFDLLNIEGGHLRFTQTRALGRKVSDEFVVPLCRGHHREVHRHGDETAWWKRAGIDPISQARALWRETHPIWA